MGVERWTKQERKKGKIKKVRDKEIEEDRQTERDKGEKRQINRRQSRETKGGLDERERENCAPWPPIFIHQRSTSGNCLSGSECMHGSLAPCKGSYYKSLLSLVSSFLFLSLIGTADPLCRERQDARILSYSIIHAFLLATSPSKQLY